MSELAAKHCSSPGKDDDPLPGEQVERLIQELDGAWEVSQDMKRITRDFQFKNFYQTMAFANALAWIANQEDHHPDLEVSYKHCIVHFSTHAIGGLSENDFILAAKADGLVS